MKKLIVIAGAIGIVIFQSCGSDKKTESETVATEQPTVQSEVATTDSTQMQTPGQPLEINSTQPAISSAPVTTPTTAAPAATATAAGMNPAHGQPGHRCDIAVGAPLSSPPNKQTTATPSITPTSPTINSTTPTITPSSSSPQIQTTPVVSPAAAGPTPAGMNPPHGQPGHDCSVAVGAPLKK